MKKLISVLLVSVLVLLGTTSCDLLQRLDTFLYGDYHYNCDCDNGCDEFVTIAGREFCALSHFVNIDERFVLTERYIQILESLTNLRSLVLSNNRITDISLLKSLTNLQSLAIRGNPITDISPLESLTNLWDLSIWDTQVTDISPLKSLTNLQMLSLNGNPITDFSPLESLTDLRWLTLWNSQITDISPLESLTNLRDLSLDDSSLTMEQIEELRVKLPETYIRFRD